MKISELASLLAGARLDGDESVELTGIQTDSRKVRPGDLFICLPGHAADGHDYAAKAVAQGAAALVVEREVGEKVPTLHVKDSRLAMAILANRFYDYPSREFKVIGITGTNGKTTTTYIIDKLLTDHGARTGRMGTIEMKIGSETFPVQNTTQEALALQHNFRRMRDQQADYCIMEVSSHALQMGRVKGVRFRTAIFTNLTQDHLDYHGSMEEYRAAKGLLFSRLGNEYASDAGSRQFAVLNGDDPASYYYQSLTAVEVLTYGIDKPADFQATDIRVTSRGTEFKLTAFGEEETILLKLIGKFNVYNALAAIAAAWIEGVPLSSIKKSLSELSLIEGRMEPVDEGQSFSVLVDFAHTPDGLENALTTVREFAEGRILTVFGCGGDRDKTKRPLMGAIAARYSDYVIATSDNPRSEDPSAILEDVRPGIVREAGDAKGYILLPDRREAIRKAVEMAGPDDVILIAGKGHETYQIIGGTTHHFDDREEARNAIKEKKS
ncbi:UDP-N-acetylmuramoyl-L-alanyl-D-glutamate--2,6-diaminopimelate ligase [Paenibacillus aurantius]|uniref:UDP-N-acetylmuramoyl-L-alanyl-D-glutamate--2,6-diaminopimelate ligase n=1 Tax=Paenibacillus aurantius TaxID=2918900 RepID=A0AA96RG82_9BACL|nr:UDP-N-acetylmuramoyl-L-alanyl-D-glutamate--2,6-diaminopimelate ligase [Paenibacillus aurantius]WNQ14215.1 UDP-N-acetylmuramoyl-L-alanyl-D-glutamate--2,6-diaminopimelate ligase [Paenibacillus aurantius]